MARLILSLDGQVLAEYNMTKERYTVGRLPDNDVRIDNAAVSGHHGLIINILNDSFLEDLNSTNGTYVNGKLIKKHALTHGDVITIGHHHLRFVDSQVESSEQDEFERTLVIQPGQVNEARLKAAAESVAPAATAAASAAPSPAAAAAAEKGAPARPAKLQVLSGQFAGRELELCQDPDDARPARRAGRGDQPSGGRLLRRPRGKQQAGRLPAGQRPADRATGAQAPRQRRRDARRREDGLLRSLGDCHLFRFGKRGLSPLSRRQRSRKSRTPGYRRRPRH